MKSRNGSQRLTSRHSCRGSRERRRGVDVAPRDKRRGRVRTGAPDRIRTCGLQLRRLSLYPAELRARTMKRREVVRPEGLEPPAYRFEACRSIQLSYGRARSMVECSPPRAARQGARPVRRECVAASAGACARISVCANAAVRRRSPCVSPAGPVAQLAEQQTLNLRVEGSIPSRLTTLS